MLCCSIVFGVVFGGFAGLCSCWDPDFSWDPKLDLEAAQLCSWGSACCTLSIPAQSWQCWDGARKVLGLKPAWHCLSIHTWGNAPAPSSRPRQGAGLSPPCHAMPPEWHRAGFGCQMGLDLLLGRAVGAAGVGRAMAVT